MKSTHYPWYMFIIINLFISVNQLFATSAFHTSLAVNKMKDAWTSKDGDPLQLGCRAIGPATMSYTGSGHHCYQGQFSCERFGAVTLEACLSLVGNHTIYERKVTDESPLTTGLNLCSPLHLPVTNGSLADDYEVIVLFTIWYILILILS